MVIAQTFSGRIEHTKRVSKQGGGAIGLSYMAGNILIHTPKIYVDKPPYSSGLELSYKKQTTGRKEWHQRYGFPEVGMNMFFSMNGSTQLGYAVGIYPSIQFHLLKVHKVVWYWKIGGGMAWASTHWQRVPFVDSLNNIIGSAVNNFTMIQSGVRYPLNKYWSAQAGIHFYHLSNAAARSPNYGINTFGIHVGMNYHPNGMVTHIEKQKLRRHRNSLNLCVLNSIAFAEDKTPDGPLYPVYTGSLSIHKMIRNKSRILLGGDAIYNWRTRATIHNALQMRGPIFLSPWQFTAFAGHEFLFGRVGVPLIAGAYLNRPVGGEKMYQKLGLMYHFYHPHGGTFKDAHLSLMLKTHLVQAQYAELGFGFYL